MSATENSGELLEVADLVTGPARRVVNNFGGCRVRFTWISTQKSLTKEQKVSAASVFEMDDGYLSATKKLFDTKDAAFKKVTTIKNDIAARWHALTLPYVESGVRLIRLDDIANFSAEMEERRSTLLQAVEVLDGKYAELVSEARRRLATLFNPNDYPQSIIDQFSVSWDFPALNPPEYLQYLAPRVYQAEAQQWAERFDQVVDLAERAFIQEFSDAVAHLCERLDGTNPDGSPKIFRDSVVDNLNEWFTRFGRLNLRSNADLTALVERARNVLGDRNAADLRGVGQTRYGIARQMNEILDEVQELAATAAESQPAASGRRNLIRTPKVETTT